MFGIGLPEMILIMAVALIVVGPDKLPELAKSLARQLLELKKAAQSLKDNFTEELEDDLKPWKNPPPKAPQIQDLLKDNFQRAQPSGKILDKTQNEKDQNTAEADTPGSVDPTGQNSSGEPDIR